MTEKKEQKWQPLRELALVSPYTMEYLSLMARRKELKVKKIGRIWYSTPQNIQDFEKERAGKKEVRKKQLRKKYLEKISKDNKKIKVKVFQHNILDEVQRELEEVLQEIREKEKRLRGEMLKNEEINVGIRQFTIVPQEKTEKYLEKEKQETEELSEKLIMDLGKLINTANRVYDGQERKINRPASARYATKKIKEKGVFSIPIRNPRMHNSQDIKLAPQSPPDNGSHAPFLALNYPAAVRREYDYKVRSYQEQERIKNSGGKKGFVLFLVGMMMFLSVILLLLLV